MALSRFLCDCFTSKVARAHAACIRKHHDDDLHALTLLQVPFHGIQTGRECAHARYNYVRARMCAHGYACTRGCIDRTTRTRTACACACVCVCVCVRLHGSSCFGAGPYQLTHPSSTSRPIPALMRKVSKDDTPQRRHHLRHGTCRGTC